MLSADSEIGPRCGIVLSELAPDVELALDLGTGPRLGTHPRSESNIYITNCIEYWCKLLCMSNHRYPMNCYKMLKSLDEAGRNTWASSVRRLLYMYGGGYAWVAQEIGSENAFIPSVQNSLNSLYEAKLAF